jgi:hypothetical protein
MYKKDPQNHWGRKNLFNLLLTAHIYTAGKNQTVYRIGTTLFKIPGMAVGDIIVLKLSFDYGTFPFLCTGYLFQNGSKKYCVVLAKLEEMVSKIFYFFINKIKHLHLGEFAAVSECFL